MTTRLTRWIGLIGSCGLLTAVGASWTPAPQPEVEHAIEHWVRARDLVRSFQTEDPGPAVTTPTGVQIVLRHQGRPIGSAWAMASGTDDPVHAAVASAMSRALADPSLCSLTADLQRAAFEHVTVEVETAGPLIPLSAGSLEQAAADLHPGRDGVAIRVGDSWDVRFPSALRSAGAAASIDELRGMALVAGMTPQALDDARRAGAAALYRFNTVDLVQCEPGALPTAFVRGTRPDRLEIDRSRLETAAHQVTRHILEHCWQPTPDGPLRLGGTYLPHADRSDPVVAADADHLLTAIALTRIAHSGALDDALAMRARETARSLSMIEGLDTPAIVALKSAAMRTGVDGVWVDETEVLDVLRDNGAPVAARALCVWSFPRRSESEQLMRALADAEPGTLMDAMPWIALADERRVDDGSSPLLASALERLRQSLESRRVELPGDAAHGGVALDQSLASVNAVSLRAGAWLAASDLGTLEFLLGMILTEDDAACMRSPRRALGGVGYSPWDERQVPWVQAMTLIALDRALKSHP